MDFCVRSSLYGLAVVMASISGIPGLGGSCSITSLTLNVSSGMLSATAPNGDVVEVDFQGTTVAITNITFNPNCVPIIYTLTFNGPAALLAQNGTPTNVSFVDLVMMVNDTAIRRCSTSTVASARRPVTAARCS